MKTGKTITELAMEIERQQNSKRDFIASTKALEVVHGDLLDQVLAQTPQGKPAVGLAGIKVGDDTFGLNPLARNQLADWAGVPHRYADKCYVESPELYAHNMNHWLQASDDKRMIRTLDGGARAFLSDRYRPLDYADLAEAVLPVVMQMGVEIISADVTPTRLYIKAVDKRIVKDMPTGKRWGDGSHIFFDTLSPAIVISNSEVGMGTLSVETGIWTKVCTNLAISAQRSMRKYHLGAKADLGEQVMALLSDKTRRVTDAALWMQVGDVIKGAFDAARFDALIGEVQATTEQKIEGDPIKVVELVSKRLDIAEGERPSVLRHLIQGGDLTRYGLFNAITRAAEDLPDYDRATDFERLGGKLIELPGNDWDAIAKAA